MYRLKPFGVLNGREVPVIELFSDKWCRGAAALRRRCPGLSRVPDRTGKLTDICLGYDELESYRTLDACFGGTIGRCANRIGGHGSPSTAGRTASRPNEGENCLHGGIEGFHKKLWEFTCEENAVTFSYTSPDGEEGFPGAVRVEVTYRLTGRPTYHRLQGGGGAEHGGESHQPYLLQSGRPQQRHSGGSCADPAGQPVYAHGQRKYPCGDAGRRWRERRWISGHLRHLGAVSTIKPLTAGGDTTTTMRWTAEKARWRSCGAPPPASVWK